MQTFQRFSTLPAYSEGVCYNEIFVGVAQGCPTYRVRRSFFLDLQRSEDKIRSLGMKVPAWSTWMAATMGQSSRKRGSGIGTAYKYGRFLLSDIIIIILFSYITENTFTGSTYRTWEKRSFSVGVRSCGS